MVPFSMISSFSTVFLFDERTQNDDAWEGQRWRESTEQMSRSLVASGPYQEHRRNTTHPSSCPFLGRSFSSSSWQFHSNQSPVNLRQSIFLLNTIWLWAPKKSRHTINRRASNCFHLVSAHDASCFTEKEEPNRESLSCPKAHSQGRRLSRIALL